MIDNINSITQKVEQSFDQIENEIFSAEAFSEWRGAFEVKKVYLKKENADIKCDLDIRLAHWPEGVYVKAYKHKALAVLAYVKDPQVCQDFLKVDAVPCKFWKESFYFSHMDNLDQERYVLLEGNDMTEADTRTCLDKVKAHIEEIEQILAAQ